MSVILDIISSMMIGGIILLIVFNANIITTESWMSMNNTMLVQEMLVSTTSLLEGELRNMGYNVTPENLVVIEAQDTSIKFLSDLNRPGQPGFGTPDELHYYLGPPGEVNFMNQKVRKLYRRVNQKTPAAIGFVTKFSLHYRTQSGVLLTTPVIPSELSMVYEVEIEIEVQNPHGIYRDPSIVKAGEEEAMYSTSYWRLSRLASRNLRR